MKAALIALFIVLYALLLVYLPLYMADLSLPISNMMFVVSIMIALLLYFAFAIRFTLLHVIIALFVLTVAEMVLLAIVHFLSYDSISNVLLFSGGEFMVQHGLISFICANICVLALRIFQEFILGLFEVPIDRRPDNYKIMDPVRNIFLDFAKNESWQLTWMTASKRKRGQSRNKHFLTHAHLESRELRDGFAQLVLLRNGANLL